MNAREAIRVGIDMGQLVALAYLEDLTDKELLHRPDPKCNHINWQVGHLISSEHQMIEAVAPNSMPALPADFAEKYADDGSQFCCKEELLAAFHQQRAATLAVLEKCQDADLDKPSPESMQAYAPNVGAAFSMQGSHWLMHVGQWAVIRRQLGRPPLF
jgi:hypothetical protein